MTPSRVQFKTGVNGCILWGRGVGGSAQIVSDFFLIPRGKQPLGKILCYPRTFCPHPHPQHNTCEIPRRWSCWCRTQDPVPAISTCDQRIRMLVNPFGIRITITQWKYTMCRSVVNCILSVKRMSIQLFPASLYKHVTWEERRREIQVLKTAS